MKLTKIYSLTLITVLGLSGCSKVEDYQDDPNRVVRVSPDFLLPDIEVNAFKILMLVQHWRPDNWLISMELMPSSIITGNVDPLVIMTISSR